VFFFDEAHLLFRDASKAFLEQVEQVVRLIRSKGVGVFFVTQTPKDVPETVLAQLSTRVQHALRAHTPDDEAALRATVRTFPKTPHYDLQQTITSLGIGEAVVTGLSPRGVPTPVMAVKMVAPASRMGPLTAKELEAELAASGLLAEYGTAVNRESAFEILAKRLEARPAPPSARTPFPAEAAEPQPRRQAKTKMGGLAGALTGALTGTMARTLGRELVRGVLGMLQGKAPRSTRRRTRW